MAITPAPGPTDSNIPRAGAPLPTGTAKVRAVRSMFDAIAPRYVAMNRLMTFGLDRRWRTRTIDALGVGPGGLVIDLACGPGDLTVPMLRRGIRAIGVDLSFGMLAAGTRPFPRVQGDALRLPFADNSVDGATCGFALRNLEALPPFFAELHRVLRPGGRIGLLEVSEPTNPLLRAGHHIHFNHVVPLLGAAFSNADAYRYLPRSVSYLPEPETMVAQLTHAGFDRVVRRALSGGIVQLITATREGLAR